MRWALPWNASAWVPPSGVVLWSVMFDSVKSAASTPNIARLLPLSALLSAYWTTVRSRSSPWTEMNGWALPTYTISV